jgi:ACS family hexuronate transporter-like MFS transporter
MGGVMGILSQTAVGWTVQNLSFTPVFAVAAFLHLTAFLGVTLLAGRIGTVTDQPGPSLKTS